MQGWRSHDQVGSLDVLDGKEICSLPYYYCSRHSKVSIAWFVLYLEEIKIFKRDTLLRIFVIV